MPNIATPTTITAYPTTAGEGIIAFPWALQFDKAIYDPSTVIYELQVDTFPTFASPNLIDVTQNSASIQSFQNGPLGKAIILQLPKRTLTTTTWYWRVRIAGGGYAGGYTSSWSQINSFTMQADTTFTQADTMFSNVADENAYSKQGNSINVYKILEMIGREVDQLLLENNYTQSDLSIDQARDAAISGNFGPLVALQQTSTEPAVSYRWKVRQLFKTFLNYPGVITGILGVVEAFVGEPPIVQDFTSINGWILGQNFINSPQFPQRTQPPIILYSRAAKGFNWSLYIYNSWNLPLDKKVLQNYVLLIMPPMTNVQFFYPTSKHFQIRFNTASDWNSCVLTNLTTNQSGGLTLVNGQSSGTAVTPVINIPNLNGWDVLQLTQDLVGQTITVQLQSSPTGLPGSFSSPETLVLGQAPISTPLQPYIQMTFTISTTNTNNKPVLNAAYLNCIHS